ncbi:MAG: TolC family protein [Sporomusaceae bacterium]|nr:TolC family protein [Sporomusaceae bacterium]
MRIKILLIALAVLSNLLLPGKSYALSLQECIDSALTLHPDLNAAAGRLDAKRAAIGQAEADRKWQFSASSSYTRSGGDQDSGGAYSNKLKAEQLLYDFGKSGLKVKAAEVSQEAAAADYLTARDTVIADVREAYYSLNQAVRQTRVAATRYDNYRKRLEWAEAYYEAGTKARIEVTKARADLANAKLDLVKAQSEVAASEAELASAMGQPLLRLDSVDDALAYQAYEITLEQALARALDTRPELTASRKNVEYAQLNLALQKKGMAGSVSTSADYGFSGSAPFDDRGWSAGVSLAFPLGDGGLTKSKISGAAAELATAAAEQGSLENAVRLSVRKTWEALKSAREALTAALASETEAQETLDLANARYQAGVGDSLEISDAVETYATAQTATVSALYQYQQARLELEKAMGGLADELDQ